MMCGLNKNLTFNIFNQSQKYKLNRATTITEYFKILLKNHVVNYFNFNNENGDDIAGNAQPNLSISVLF